MKEPADLVWVSNRCAVLMYMTSGKKSFDQKRRHNHIQLHRWMRHWRGGELLSGDVDDRKLSYRYEDIDQIIGLSVIGGPDIGCIFEYDQLLFGDDKLTACATITDAVLSKLARRSVGVRDLVDFIRGLRALSGRVDEQSAFTLIDHWVWHWSAQARTEFQQFDMDPSDLNEAWHQTANVFQTLKNSNPFKNGHEFLSDLSISDAIWLSVAERSLAEKIAEPGTYGPLMIGARRRSGPHTMLCVVCAHMGIVSRNKKDFEALGGFDLLLISTLELGRNRPIRMMLFNPNLIQANPMLVASLNELRQPEVRPSVPDRSD